MSTETHIVSTRAADMLGLGAGNVKVPVGPDYRIRVDELRADRRGPRGGSGRSRWWPTGDGLDRRRGSLEEIAALCAEEDLWFHVDAAYGGRDARRRPASLFAGIERADSVAFDPHKWLYTPQSGGCVVVRDLELMRRAFDVDYVAYVVKDEEHTDWGVDLGRHSPNFSRGFWALKVWVSLLAHGKTPAYGKRISRRGARPVPGRARGGARGVRADDAGRLSIMFPLRAVRSVGVRARATRPVGTRTSTSSTTG